LDTVKKSQIDKDIASQVELFSKWQKEQQADLNEQIRNFAIELKKESVLDRLARLERQEEILTFFDNQQRIKDTYHGKGFPDENPADIPIEPDQTSYKIKSERHFKPWPKYMNRPVIPERIRKQEEYKLDSLRKIYFNNSKAQTTPEMKLDTKSKQAA
jgi:hypothetical protein